MTYDRSRFPSHLLRTVRAGVLVACLVPVALRPAGGTLLVATIPPGNAAGARWTAQPLALKDFPDGRITSFIWALGEDDDGELYVLANGMNSAFGTRGKVFKLVLQ